MARAAHPANQAPSVKRWSSPPQSPRRPGDCAPSPLTRWEKQWQSPVALSAGKRDWQRAGSEPAMEAEWSRERRQLPNRTPAKCVAPPRCNRQTACRRAASGVGEPGETLQAEARRGSPQMPWRLHSTFSRVPLTASAMSISPNSPELTLARIRGRSPNSVRNVTLVCAPVAVQSAPCEPETEQRGPGNEALPGGRGAVSGHCMATRPSLRTPEASGRSANWAWLAAGLTHVRHGHVDDAHGREPLESKLELGLRCVDCQGRRAHAHVRERDDGHVVPAREGRRRAADGLRLQLTERFGAPQRVWAVRARPLAASQAHEPAKVEGRVEARARVPREGRAGRCFVVGRVDGTGHVVVRAPVAVAQGDLVRVPPLHVALRLAVRDPVPVLHCLDGQLGVCHAGWGRGHQLRRVNVVADELDSNLIAGREAGDRPRAEGHLHKPHSRQLFQQRPDAGL